MIDHFSLPPSKDMYDEILRLAMSGLSLKEVGDYYGRDPLDWVEMCEKYPMIENRFNCGKARGIALAGAKLLQEINYGKINAITFYLKTKGNFTEKSILELEETLKHENATTPPVPKDPVQASKIYQQFMKDS